MTQSPDIKDFQSLSPADLIKQYQKSLFSIHTEVTHLTDNQANQTFNSKEAGTWSCQILVGHLVDAEMAFIHKMRCAAVEDRPQFTSYDEDKFAKGGLYNTTKIGDSLELLTRMRQWAAGWLLTLKPEDFKRVGLHPSGKEQTIQDLLTIDVWHLEHHNWYLNHKMKILLGE